MYKKTCAARARAHTHTHTAAMLALLSSFLECGAPHKLFAEQIQLKMRYTANAATELAVTAVEA